jgi:hypothetical protein
MTISQITARTKRQVGANGEPVFAYDPEHFDTVINKAPQQAQIGTITVDTATDSATYTFTINGYVLSFVNGTGSTTTTTAALLAETINEDARVRGQVSASAAAAVVTLTGNNPGVAFTASDTDAKLTTVEASTAAASADPIPFGRFVYVSGYDSEGPEKIGTLPKSSSFSAQVDTLTVVYAAGERYTVTIDIAGESRSVDVLADTDTDTTATAIRAAINAIMPANSVVATGATDQVILTAEKPGEPFVTSVGLVTGTIARLALVHTTSGLATDAIASLAGLAILPMDEETASGTNAGQYKANVGVRTLRLGEMWVTSTEAPAYGADVYMETNGSLAGKPYAAASATRIKLPKSVAMWRRSVSADSIAALQFVSPLT